MNSTKLNTALSPRQMLNHRRVLRIPGWKTRLATWNVRSLLKPGKLANVVKEMHRMKLDILGVSEVRWKGSGQLSTTQGYTLYYSGEDQDNQYGVGILINKELIKYVTNFVPMSDRVMLIQLSGHPVNINIIQAHAPTADKPVEQLEEFYEQIKYIRRSLKKQDLNIIMGDFNAKVGKGEANEVVGRFGLGERNEQGTRLIEFCQEADLTIVNTWFELPNRRLYTWTSPQDNPTRIVRNQIDYIMINKRYKNGVTSAKTYPGADIGSDHNPVVATIRIKFKKVIQKQRSEVLDWKTIQNDNIRNKFITQIEDEIENIHPQNDIVEEREIEKTWTELKNILDKSGKDTIGRKKQEKRKEWITPEILELMERRRTIKNKNPNTYKRINQEIENKIKLAKEKWLQENCEEIERLEAMHDDLNLHRKIKMMTGTMKKKNNINITNEHNKLILDIEEKKQTWENYIKQLFNDNRGDIYPRVLSQEGPQILTSEVEHAIRITKGDKAPGDDEITIEYLKHMGDKATSLLTKLYNSIYETGIIPNEWLQSTFITLPKKPKARKCKDYRTISLMSHTLKVFLRIIYHRIRAKCEDHLSNSQFGFRKGLGTREAILSLVVMAERCLDMRKDLYVCFVDYEKAFDRIKHEKIIEELNRIGLDGKDIRIIRNLYWQQTAAVQVENEKTETIDIKRGVRQGCVLSPLLFNIYSERIIQEALDGRPEGIKINGMIINNIRYADDTIVIADSEQDLQTLMDRLNVKSKEMGLNINTAKTNSMVFSRSLDLHPSIRINDTDIRNVTDYKYLGRNINDKMDHLKEIKQRIEIARSNFMKMRNVLCNLKLSLEVRLRVMRCYIWSTVLYGCETWTLKKDAQTRIQAFEMWIYRRMLRIPWTARVTNEEVINRIGSEVQLVKIVKNRKAKYFGHIIRHREYNLLQLILEGKINGKRGQGRRKKSWFKNIKEWTEQNTATLFHATYNRTEYNMMIANLV